MDMVTAAADELGVTPRALRAALDRGETIGSFAGACGLDVAAVTAAIVDAEVSDIEALAPIAGFDDADITLFVAEMAAWLRAYVEDGEAAGDATTQAPPLMPVA